ncbi:MAG: DUF3267 domain-containing protein [Desulfuromonadales bacterium]|nr:DUF3267 domain-containing protein [Desulfuromonadales bacterium]
MLRLLLSYLTFPGIIAHEFAHAWACRILGVHVEQVCYLRFGNPMGYVLHERPASAFQHILVATAPFFVSSLLALTASFTACLFSRSQLPPETREIFSVLTMWLSFSMALHSFPSSGDANALWDDVLSPDVCFTAKTLLVPVVGLLRLSQLGSRCYVDILFAMAMVGVPPAMLLVVTGA